MDCKTNIITRKIVMLVLLFTISLCLLPACKSKEQREKEAQASCSISLTELADKIKEKDATLPSMTRADSSMEQGEDYFGYLSGIEYDKVENYCFDYATDGTAEEIAIIQLKDKGDNETCKSSLEEHVHSRKTMYDAYKPEQSATVDKAKIIVRDAYVILIISKDSGAGEKVIEEYIK